MRAHNSLRRFLLTTAGLTSLTVGFAAGMAKADGIETVTVTARRQEETLLNAPVTVTAIAGEALQDRGITDIGSIIAMVPNAVVPDDPQHFNTFINIRGIRQVDAQAEPNFGLYRNGIYNGGQRTNLGPQVDLDRIEILRGPQAGLYGRDAVGGSVNVYYRMASTDAQNGYASAKYGNYNRVELEGAWNQPLSENFAVRGAAWYFNQTGSEYYNITLNENIDAGHDYGGRLSARADLTPDLNIVWTAEYEDTEGPSQRAYAPNGVAQLFFGVGAPETKRTIQRDTPSISKDHQFYASQNVTYDSSFGRFNLLASYRDYNLKGVEDQDYTALTPVAGAFPQGLYLQQELHRAENARDFYVEGLWTSEQDQPLTWIAGFSYFDETFDFARIFKTTADLGTLLGIGPAVLSTGYFGLPSPGTNFKTRSYSAFGEATWHINSEWDLSGGLRWSEDKRTLNYMQQPIASVPPAPLDPVWAAVNSSFLHNFNTTDSPTFSFTAPTATLRYKPTEDLTFYATYGSGFRAGGFNTTTTTAAFIPYDEESANNYEVGFKSVFGDGRVGLNADIFYMTQDNLLAAQPDPIAPPFLGFTYLTNVGDARTWGVEFELLTQMTDWLNAHASVGWLDPKFTGNATSFGTPLNGKMIPYTRSATFNIGGDINTPINDRFGFVSTIDLRYESGGFLDTANSIHYDALTKLDATAGITWDENTRFVAYIKNAFDDTPAQFQFGNGAIATSLGRTYGVQLSKKF
jgi:iron complex outermembrane receptor protein